MAKLRLREAKSPWCLSPSGKQYLSLSPLLPKAGRPREEVKTTVVGVFLCALIALRSLLGMGVSRPCGQISQPKQTRPVEVGLGKLISFSGHGKGNG